MFARDIAAGRCPFFGRIKNIEVYDEDPKTYCNYSGWKWKMGKR